MITKIFTQNVYILCSCFWIYFCAENREDCATASERKMYGWYFFMLRHKEIPDRICQDNAGTEICTKAIIFNMFLSLFWYPAFNELHCPSKMFFIIIERLWKIFTQCIYFVQKPWKNLCDVLFLCRTENVQLIFFYIEDRMNASRNISMVFDERAAAS